MNSQIPDIKSRNQYWDNKFKNNLVYGNQPSLLMDFILPYIQPSMSVLVLGGGTGRNAAVLAQKGCDVTCIDISTNALIQGKSIYGDLPNLQFKQGDILNLSDQDQYDVVVAVYVLSLFTPDEVAIILNQISSLLKTDGKFMVNFLSTDDDEVGLGKSLGDNEFLLDDENQFEKFYTETDITQLLNQHDFNVLSINKVEESRFIQTWHKEMITRSWLIISEKE